MVRSTWMFAAALTLTLAAVSFAEEGTAEKAKAAGEKVAAETNTAAKEAAEKKAAEMSAAETMPASKDAMSGTVATLARLAVCTNVEDRRPVGEAESFGSDVGKLYCFTRVETPSAPVQVFHRWYVGDKMVNEIPINVKGQRWRCWSTKSIRADWNGPCRVEVVSEEGDVLGSKEFTLTAAAAPKMSQENAAAVKAEEKSGHEGHSHDLGGE